MEIARKILRDAKGKTISRLERCELAKKIAEDLLSAQPRKKSLKERKMNALMQDSKGKRLLTALTDQCFRSKSDARILDQVLYLLAQEDPSTFLSPLERIFVFLMTKVGKWWPSLFVSVIKKTLQKELSSFLLPMEETKKKGMTINYNYLGEAIQGEKEALDRLNIYLEKLSSTSIDYISVKISSLYSQLNVLDFENSVEKIAIPLRKLYREALSSNPPKFVNLDMEEYKDLNLTVAVFKKVLSEEEFQKLPAGIVLQSYIEASFYYQKELTEFALERMKKGGSHLKLRIVKGANLAMEKVESSLRGWGLAPYSEKVLTDANFKRMLEYGTQNDHAKALHIGVGSHNLLDIAYALLLGAENNCETSITIEMLKGMARPLQDSILQLADSLVLYCPETSRKDFQHAVSYLMRRLDENTAPENFIRHLFDLTPGSAAWEEEKRRFSESCKRIDSLGTSQGRQPKEETHKTFENVPDTDFTIATTRQDYESALQGWREKNEIVPLMDSTEAFEHLSIAKSNEKKWSTLSLVSRKKLLENVADELQKNRFSLGAAMVLYGKKTVAEADTEVSEGCDLVTYYSAVWEKMQGNGLSFQSKGTILIAPPWNFPVSIPISGIIAALVTGNCVLFKPAPEALFIGKVLVELFYKAGVSKDVLHFIACDDATVGSALIQDPRINAVILTGSSETAAKLLDLRPTLDLTAETGGKNTMIISNLADKDLAIKDILHSAFGHAGQKCSALSLGILHSELYDDPLFLSGLKDAALSLCCDEATNLHTKVPPLIRQPGDALIRGLTQLEEGESWLVRPQQSSENPLLWSPGIKLGVKKGSFTHQTELFGPVLGLMRAENLKEAIELANSTPYGLTAGLHSLDAREHAYWKAKIEAGNLYINRSITGAIVRRQPFGGFKNSQYGRGAKVGGPNYLAQFVHIEETKEPEDSCFIPPHVLPLMHVPLGGEDHALLKKSLQSYAYYERLLTEPSDPSYLLGQQNLFYHVPLEKLFLRFNPQDRPVDVLRAIGALILSKTPFEVSFAKEFPFEIPLTNPIVESEETFAKRMDCRVRLLSTPSDFLFRAAAKKMIFIDHSKILGHGRYEMLHYLREVSLSYDYHRYGNLYAGPTELFAF